MARVQLGVGVIEVKRPAISVGLLEALGVGSFSPFGLQGSLMRWGVIAHLGIHDGLSLDRAFPTVPQISFLKFLLDFFATLSRAKASFKPDYNNLNLLPILPSQLPCEIG